MEDYNSTTNGQTQYPVVADPADFAAINRLALINKSLERTTLTFGRQRIVHDDQRFVGNVGWRQNEQTFDGLRAQWGSPKIKTDLTYASQVNRVFGPDSPQGKWEGDVVLANFALHAARRHAGVVRLLPRHRRRRVGVEQYRRREARGSKPIGKLTGTYALAFAQQAEAGANAVGRRRRLRARRRRAQFREVRRGARATSCSAATASAAFSTPLATLHAFQGWADKFLATPAAGIEDTYVRFSYPLGKRGRFTSVAATAVFHDYEADFGSAHFGEELNLQFVARTERMALTAKYADYRADGLFTDTEKVWFSVDYSFDGEQGRSAPNRRVGARGSHYAGAPRSGCAGWNRRRS